MMTRTTAAATPPSNGALDDENDAAAAPFPVLSIVTVCGLVGDDVGGAEINRKRLTCEHQAYTQFRSKLI